MLNRTTQALMKCRNEKISMFRYISSPVKIQSRLPEIYTTFRIHYYITGESKDVFNTE